MYVPDSAAGVTISTEAGVGLSTGGKRTCACCNDIYGGHCCTRENKGVFSRKPGGGG